jgi:hypothetical protein
MNLDKPNEVYREFLSPHKNKRRKREKKLYEDTHTRQAVWFRNDLHEMVNNLMRNGERRSDIVNDALEEYFEKYKHDILSDLSDD